MTFRRSTQLGLLFVVSLWNRALFCANKPASLSRSWKQTNASLKGSIMLRRRRGAVASLLFWPREAGLLTQKTGPIRKRHLRMAPKFGVFCKKCSTRLSSFYSELIWWFSTMARNFIIEICVYFT